MLSIFQQFVNNFNKPKNWLVLANVTLVFFLITLNNLGIIPLRMGDFIFFAILTLALALYRPGWAFLFFVGTIILENVNLAPAELGLTIRPYQFIGTLTIVAIVIRIFSGKLNFKLVKLKWLDWLIIIFAISSFLSIINSSNKLISLKLSIILATFIALYFLVRNYIQNLEDVKKIIPFFLSSSAVVMFYGIWQNVRFSSGLRNFETMPGRPNATFTEADWLGIFLVLFISVIYILIYLIFNFQFSIFKQFSRLKFLITKILLFLLLTSCFVLLILTVSRSAWLGALAMTFIFLFTVFTNLKFNPRNLSADEAGWQWKKTIQMKLIIISALLIAIGTVYLFHLTNFQLGNRVQSTGTGLQKITISCEKNINLPESINNITELEKYDCRHINLEEINSEKSQGKYVAEIYRKDPNVNIRKEIYQKSWAEIKNHWVLGIGWGNISEILGLDESGTPLNSSNIFLEVWLGNGILGFASLIILFSYIILSAVKRYFFAKDLEEKVFGLFLIISWFGIVIPNLFNAGIFLGFLWVWIAIAQSKN